MHELNILMLQNAPLFIHDRKIKDENDTNTMDAA